MRRKKSKSKLHLLSNALGVAAATVLLVGITVSYRQWQANENSTSHAINTDHPGSIENSDAPSTKKPSQSEFDNYRVAADMPRYISIPKLSVRAMIKPVGVTNEGNMDVPANAHDVGWYSKSAKPGKPGAMVVDGHASVWDVPGAFYDLEKLQPGDEIQIERGDGEVITYKVSKSQTYDIDNVDMKAALAPVNPDEPGLNLITCTGEVIPGTHNFSQRIVVFAEQM